jgi:hypothetical protein
VGLFALSVHPYRNFSEIDLNGKIANEIISELLPKKITIGFFAIATLLYQMRFSSDCIVLMNYPNMKLAS